MLIYTLLASFPARFWPSFSSLHSPLWRVPASLLPRFLLTQFLSWFLVEDAYSHFSQLQESSVAKVMGLTPAWAAWLFSVMDSSLVLVHLASSFESKRLGISGAVTWRFHSLSTFLFTGTWLEDVLKSFPASHPVGEE